MIIDVFLSMVALFTAGFAFLMAWRKIPLLLQVPQHLIDESFVTRPSRVKNGLDLTIKFFRQKKYRDYYYIASIWTLSHIRLWLMRFERVIFHGLERMRERSYMMGEFDPKAAMDLKQLKEWKQAEHGSIPDEVLYASESEDTLRGNDQKR